MDRVPKQGEPVDLTARLGALERALLNDFQRDFPLGERPFAVIADRLGSSEAEVLGAFEMLQSVGAISRIGAVVRPHRTGWSTLAAMSVPDERLVNVAALVSSYPEVNHNYERDHALNLWFVVTGADQGCVTRVLEEIERRSGLEVLDLPLEEPFRLDLGFEIRWPDA
jgi:DNA-binding Lrp family transcriptional regulator